MKISTLLLKPYLAQLESQFRDLDRELNQRPSEETSHLKAFIGREMKSLEGLRDSVTGIEETGDNTVSADLYDEFRRMKLDLRFTRRKWLRLISNEARNRKIREKRSHVSTFAA